MCLSIPCREVEDGNGKAVNKWKVPAGEAVFPFHLVPPESISLFHSFKELGN